MEEVSHKGRGREGGPYIWLSYRTQYAVNGRTHTLEMEIPVPIGASAEEREALIREAEAGLDQVAGYVKRRTGQSATGRPAESVNGLPTPTPAAQPIGRTTNVPPVQQPRRDTNVSAGASEGRPAAEAREVTEGQAPAAPRRSVGQNMPATPGVGSNGDLTIPQFLQAVRDNFQMTPGQVQETLKVKSLQNINRREALDQLRYLLGQESQVSAPDAPAASRGTTGAQIPAPIIHTAAPNALREAGRSSTPTPSANDTQLSAYRFDEEEDDDGPSFENNEPEDELPDVEVVDGRGRFGQQEPLRESSIEERVHVKTLLSKLREAKGSTAANQGRINALWNVIGTQIDEDQLQQLIKVVWSATTLKQLKIDQVESLISWAKEDDFENDVNAVLELG